MFTQADARSVTVGNDRGLPAYLADPLIGSPAGHWERRCTATAICGNEPPCRSMTAAGQQVVKLYAFTCLDNIQYCLLGGH